MADSLMHGAQHASVLDLPLPDGLESAFGGPRASDRTVVGQVVKKMGTGSGPTREKSGGSASGEVPVPILSQPLTAPCVPLDGRSTASGSVRFRPTRISAAG